MNARYNSKGELPKNLIEAEAKWLKNLAGYQSCGSRRTPRAKKLHANMVLAADEIHEILNLRYNGCN